MVEKNKKPITVGKITLWFGLLFGYLEVGVLSIQQQLMGEYIFRSRDYLWMTPLANVLLFMLPGLLMVFVAVWVPRFVPIPGLVFFDSFLGAIGLFLLVEKFNRFVVVFLALMVAVNAARFTYQGEEKLIALVHQSFVWFVIFFFVLVMIRFIVF